MNRAILFDLDGVLIDSMRCHARTWRVAIKNQLNIEIPEEYFLINEGRNSKDLLVAVIKEHQIDADDDTWQKVSDYRDQLFLEAFTPRLVNGAKELVQLLHGFGYRLGVATGSTQQVVEELLLKTGIRDYFSELVTSEDVQFSKPHPQPYQLLLQRLQASTENALVIENAPLGIASAIAADLICLAVATTNTPEVLDHASKVFSNMSEIGIFLENEYSQTKGVGVWGFQSTIKEIGAS
ncbi:MAG: HAD family phosphatase [Anaerolineaceae bacterium]|nr:HAD family phosphatase [Anaerolineaceae bacterium]